MTAKERALKVVHTGGMLTGFLAAHVGMQGDWFALALVLILVVIHGGVIYALTMFE